MVGLIAAGVLQSSTEPTSVLPVPIRLAEAAGWGVPAVDADAVYYLTRRHELVGLSRSGDGVRWKAVLDEHGSPTAGTAILPVGELVIAGDYDVFAHDRLTGRRRWRFSPPIGHGVGHYLSDTSAAGLVFTGSPSGRAYAVEAATGRLRWVSEPLAPAGVVSPPILAGEGIVVGYTDASRAPQSGGIALLDMGTGTRRWQVSFADYLPVRAAGFGGGLMAFGDVLVAATGDGTIHAFDQVTGTIRWTCPPVQLESAGGGRDHRAEDVRPMTGQGRTLVVGSVTGQLSALDVDTGRERWRFWAPHEGSIGFGLRSDRAAVYVPYLSGRIIAVSLSTGRELWWVGGTALRFFWPPAVHAHGLYGSTDSGLYFIPLAAATVP